MTDIYKREHVEVIIEERPGPGDEVTYAVLRSGYIRGGWLFIYLDNHGQFLMIPINKDTKVDTKDKFSSVSGLNAYRISTNEIPSELENLCYFCSTGVLVKAFKVAN